MAARAGCERTDTHAPLGSLGHRVSDLACVAGPGDSSWAPAPGWTAAPTPTVDPTRVHAAATDEVAPERTPTREPYSEGEEVDPGGRGVLAFLAGYDTAGGDRRYREHVVDVVECESHWQIDPGNPDYRGLAQFTPSTWSSYARPGADWRDPWEQGWAVADLIGDLEDRGVSPGSTAGWPYCWWAE